MIFSDKTKVSLNLNVLSLPNIDMLKKISKDVYNQKW